MQFGNGGEFLVEILRMAEVDTVFGIVSIHNMPLVEAVDRALRFVPVRHEAAAVNAADGYARARGGLGCAITSTGTGAGNAAGSLVEALAAGSSVLHITGQIPSEYLGAGRGFIHETKDQAGMLAAVSLRAHTIRHSDEVVDVLQRGVAEATGPLSGPVSVEWPIDLQYPPVTADPDVAGFAPTAPNSASIEEAARLLSGAARPVVWIGGGAKAARLELCALVERLGAAVLTSNSGRGIVPEDHPQCVGNYASSAAGQALLDEADVLLSVGTHFRSNETETYRLRIPATHIQVDIDGDAIGRVYPVKVGVRADARLAVAALTVALGEPKSLPSWLPAVTATREAVRAEQRANIGPQAEICAAIRSTLPRNGIIARDVTIPSSSWGNRLLDIYDCRDNIFARGGGIGQGLAMGIGAAIGRPDVPVLVIAGDGGIAVHLGELLTLAQESLRVTVVVFNDQGYGVLRNMQDAGGRARAGVDLVAPDFELLSRAVGIEYLRIDAVADAAPVLARAIGRGGPVLVEVDVDAIGPMPKSFVPPVDELG